MSTPYSLRNAVSAHARWKVRILNAVDGQACDVKATDAACDDRCDLGTWLRGPTVPEPVRTSPEYSRIVTLHRDFHVCAGRVLALVEAGQGDAARQLMAHGECYDRASLALVSALMTWRW